MMTFLLRNKNRIFYQLPITFLILWLFLHPQQLYATSLEALKIWLLTLIPSMFLAMILIRFLHALGIFHLLGKWLHPFSWHIFHIDGNAFAYVLTSLFLGFPASAMLIDEAYYKQLLSKDAARRLILCVSCASFGFISVTCPLLYQDETIVMPLLFSQLGAIAVLLFVTRSTVIVSDPIHMTSTSFYEACTQSIRSSGYAIFIIGTYVLIITSLHPLIQFLLPPRLALFPRILMEFSSGTILLASLPFSFSLRLSLQSALLGFAGFCVHMQIMAMIPHIKLSYFHYFLYRILQALLAFAFAFFFFSL